MALLVTLFLVLVNIFNSVTGNAPKAEGLTAVETWVTNPPFSSSAMMSYQMSSSPGGLLHHPRIWGASRVRSHFENYPGDFNNQRIFYENNRDHYPVGEAERCKSPQGIPQSAE